MLNITFTNRENCIYPLFFLLQDNVKASFDLNHLYNECKSNPLKRKKGATDTEHKKEVQITHIKSE
jgi:hypothetical protein